MNTFMTLPLLMAAEPAGGMNQLFQTLILIVPMILIFYFLIIRPQSKQKKEMANMLSKVKKGDKVVTIGGVHGVVQSVKDDYIILRVEEGKIRFKKDAVSSILEVSKDEETEEKTEDDKK